MTYLLRSIVAAAIIVVGIILGVVAVSMALANRAQDLQTPAIVVGCLAVGAFIAAFSIRPKRGE